MRPMLNMTIARLRRIDLSEIPSGVWALLALALLLVVNLSQSNFGFEPARVPSAILSAGPFFFAAAVIYAVPKDRKLVLGAVLLAVSTTLRLVETLLPPLARFEWTSSEVYRWVHSIGWVPALAGFLLLGLGLGGVRSRQTWLIVGSVLIVSAAVFVVNVNSLVNTEGLQGSGMLIPSVLSSVGFTVIVASSYFFATAFDHRLLLTALGVGITLALWLLSLVLQSLQLGPETDFTLLNAASTIATIVSWVALIAGAILEFPSAAQERQPAAQERLPAA